MPPELELLFKVGEVIGLFSAAAAIFVKLGRLAERFELIGKQQAAEITELKNAVDKIGAVMLEVALQKQQLDDLRARANLLDQRYEDLRMGKGYIVPRSP